MSPLNQIFQLSMASATLMLPLLLLLTKFTVSQQQDGQQLQQGSTWMFDEAKQCLGNEGRQASLDKIQPEVYYFQVGQNKNGQKNIDGSNRSPKHIFKLGYNDQEFIKANINSSQPIKVIAHGFDNSFNITTEDDWIQAMIDVLDRSPTTTYNVFIFNWPNGFVRESDGLISGYGIVAGTTRTLGSYLGSFLIRMNQAIGVRFDHTHLIGHSLGAHVVGFAGKYLKQNLPSGVTLARITGLDPAGPCFQLVYPKDRIDTQDADYVDIIHSNSGLLGALQQIGNRDVYLNGGSVQTGCATWDSPCSHQVAYRVLTYEPLEQCHMIAYQCKNFDEFSRGACRHCQSDETRCTLVNFPINLAHDEYEPKIQNKVAFKPNGTELDRSVQDNLVTGLLQNSFRIFKSLSIRFKEPYYVNTGDNLSKSYCLQHYQVKLYVSIPKGKNVQANNRGKGENQITVDHVMLINSNSSDGQEHRVSMSKLIDFKGNKLGSGLWTGLLTFDGDIQMFDQALITLNSSSNSLANEQIYLGASVEFMSHICPKKRQLYSSVLCSSNLINNDSTNEGNNKLTNDKQQLQFRLGTCGQLTSDQLDSMFNAAPRQSKSLTDLFKWFG